LRTKVVTFAPRFIVINRTPWAIEVEQCDSEGAPNLAMFHVAGGAGASHTTLTFEARGLQAARSRNVRLRAGATC